MLLLDVWMMRSVNLSKTVFMFYLLLFNENFTILRPLRVPVPLCPDHVLKFTTVLISRDSHWLPVHNRRDS